MSQSIIDKVAKAICLDRAEPWDNLIEDEKQSWRETAKAAIQASELSDTIKQYVINTDTVEVVTQKHWDLAQHKLCLISATLRCSDDSKLLEAFKIIIK